MLSGRWQSSLPFNVVNGEVRVYLAYKPFEFYKVFKFSFLLVPSGSKPVLGVFKCLTIDL